MEEVKELREKIQVLETRIKYLEKEERKRKTKSLISLASRIIVYIVIAILLYRAYVYVDKTFITPYKETMEKIEGIYDKTKDNKILDWFKQ